MIDNGIQFGSLALIVRVCQPMLHRKESGEKQNMPGGTGMGLEVAPVCVSL